MAFAGVARAEERQWVFSPNDPLRGGELSVNSFYSYSKNRFPSSVIEAHSFGLLVAGAPHDRVSVWAELPFRQKSLESKFAALKFSEFGVGDLSLGLELYALREISASSSLDVSIYATGTFPTGEYNTKGDVFFTPTTDPEVVQPGRDAYAYRIGISGGYRTEAWRAASSVSYKDWGKSRITDFGEDLVISIAGAFQPLRIESGALPEQGGAVTFGMSVIASSDDRSNWLGYFPLGGGGWSVYASPGIEYFIGDWVLDLNARVPLQYNLTGGYEPADFSLAFDLGCRI